MIDSGQIAYSDLVAASFDLAIERGSGPLHLAIAEQLAAAIRSGRLEPGTRLPPERELAESIGVSRMTVRQALGALERDGLLRRVVGRGGGTFVREPESDRHTTGSSGLSAGLRRQGLADGAEVISVDVTPSRRRAAAALGLEPGAPLVVVVRLRLAGGKPLAVERSSLPAKLFPDIEDMDLGGSLYDLMEEGYGLRPVRAAEQLEVVPARASDARALGVREGTPLLLVERIGYAADGTAVEFARDRFRSDRTHLVIESTGVQE
jgi:GntR family transcriptional regulator